LLQATGKCAENFYDNMWTQYAIRICSLGILLDVWPFLYGLMAEVHLKAPF